MKAVQIALSKGRSDTRSLPGLPLIAGQNPGGDNGSPALSIQDLTDAEKLAPDSFSARASTVTSVLTQILSMRFCSRTFWRKNTADFIDDVEHTT
jgi:hypothetical protein